MTTFSIAQLERTLPDNVVTTVHWTASKTDGDHSASTYASLALPSKDPNDDDFVPFESLTEAQAIEWVQSVLGEETVAAIESSLDSQIEAQANPVSASGVPW